MSDYIQSKIAVPGRVGITGICLSGPTGPDNAALGWHLQAYVGRSDTEGSPGTPCLVLKQPGAWRFRWAVEAGELHLSINVKQPANTAPYPTMVIRANAAIGVAADVTGTSPGGAGWVTIGPITVNPTSAGVLWVELRNNCMVYDEHAGNELPWAPAYFDNLAST